MILKPHTQRIQDRGFTVVELLVTLGIVVLVTGIVMVRYSSFNSSVLLTSQAYLTAFDIREAQSLAISVRGNSSQFREQYGLYFNMASPNQYLLFQDNNDNNTGDVDIHPARYNAGEAIGTPYKVDPRFVILDICGTNSASRTCYSQDASFNNLAISFKRPNFDAAFYSTGKSALQSIEIIVGNTNSPITKSVIVYASGQISVE